MNQEVVGSNPTETTTKYVTNRELSQKVQRNTVIGSAIDRGSFESRGIGFLLTLGCMNWSLWHQTNLVLYIIKLRGRVEVQLTSLISWLPKRQSVVRIHPPQQISNKLK